MNEVQTLSRRRSIFQFAGLGELSARMIENSHTAELDLVAGMICNPRRAVPFVLGLGITIDAFYAEDLRTIAAVAIAAAQQPDDLTPDEIYRLAEQTLRDRGHWSDDAPIAPPYCCLWSGRNLRTFMGMHYYCRASLSRDARRAIELRDIRRRVARHLFRASDLAMEAACIR